MANWAEGLKVLGEGLGRIGAVRVEKEERELEAMRREALEEIRREHETEERRLDRSARADEARRDRRQAAERQAEGFAHAESQQRELFGQQTRLAEKDAVESLNRELTRQLISLDSEKSAATLKLTEYMKELDPNPEGVKALTDYIKGLDVQAKNLRQAHAIDVRRITSGKGYGKPLSEDDVAKLIGAKGSNDDATSRPQGAAPGPPPAAGGTQLRDVTSRASQAGVPVFQPPAGKVGGPPGAETVVTGASVAGPELFTRNPGTPTLPEAFHKTGVDIGFLNTPEENEADQRMRELRRRVGATLR